MSLISVNEDFQSILDKSHKTPVVVQFSADWNSSCGIMEPIMKELATRSDGKWLLAILNIEENALATAQYNIRYIPDIKIFHKGEVLRGIKGVFPSHFIDNWLNDNLPIDGDATTKEDLEEEAYTDEVENTDVEAVEEEIVEDIVEEIEEEEEEEDTVEAMEEEEDDAEEEEVEEEIVEDIVEEEEEDDAEEEETEEGMSNETVMALEAKVQAMRAEAQEAIQAIQALQASKAEKAAEEAEITTSSTIVPVSKDNAEAYTWGEKCTGWPLVQSSHLSIIEELMPANTSEQRHYHNEAEQFFYILSGEAILEVEGETVMVHQGEGLHIPAQQSHQIQNLTDGDLRFLLISHPSTKDDRIED